jgi:surface antigen
MRSKAFPLLLLACAALTPTIASAFTFGFLRNTVLQRLTPEDIQIGSRATRVALDSGENGEWSNPATGASGTIRILATVDVDDRRGCRRTRLAVTAGGQTGSGTYILCKVRSGEWNFYTPRPGATLTPSQADPGAPANAT